MGRCPVLRRQALKVGLESWSASKFLFLAGYCLYRLHRLEVAVAIYANRAKFQRGLTF